MQKIFDTIDSLYDKYVAIWEKICNIESPTASKEGVDAVGKFFIDFATEKGWKVEVFPQPLVGDVITITMNPDAKGQPVSISGHMDTVHPIGSFGMPPVRIDGDRIYGPGVCDCKGGLVVGLLAMEALDTCGFCARPVKFLLQSDEENGSRLSGKATIQHICEQAKDSVAFLNLEGYTPGTMCTARKGIITFTFKIHGIEAHSSSCAKSGANAIAEAAYKIIEMEKLKDDEGLTCNCGVISGGTVPNTVAGYCEFKANVRFATAEQLAWVTEYAKQVAETTHINGCTCEIEQFGFRVAMEPCEMNDKLATRINEIFEDVGFSALKPFTGKGGSDAADTTVFGIPSVDQLGAQGGRIHSPDEYGVLSSLPELAKRIASLICHL